MSDLSTESGPGYFYVLSEPKTPEDLDEIHDWYNTEHGPLRMKLDFIANGYRYKSIGKDPPVWLATYDLKRISGLSEPQYTVLRENRSSRESNIISSKISYMDRRIYKDLSCRGEADGPAPIMMSVAFVVKDEHVPALNRWYEEEHIDDLSKIPGWRRTRRFQLVQSQDMKEGYTELLAVHDFDKINGLDGPEHELAKTRPWRMKTVELVEKRVNMRFEHIHTFLREDYRSPVAYDASNGHVKHIWNFAFEELEARYPGQY